MTYEEACKLTAGNFVTDVQTGTWCEVDQITMILADEVHVTLRHPQHGIVRRHHHELQCA